MHRIAVSLLALLMASLVYSAALTSLPQTTVLTSPTLNASVSLGYLPAAQALFFNLAANSSGIIGFVQVMLPYNSTNATFQLLLLNATVCPQVYNAASATLYVTSISPLSPADETMMTFQVAPINWTLIGNSSAGMAVGVGSADNATCNATQPLVATSQLFLGSAFLANVTALSIANASSSCQYGSPNATVLSGCAACFPGFSGTTCNISGNSNASTTPTGYPSTTAAPNSTNPLTITTVPFATPANTSAGGLSHGQVAVLIIVIVVIVIIVVIAVVVYVRRSKNAVPGDDGAPGASRAAAYDTDRAEQMTAIGAQPPSVAVPKPRSAAAAPPGPGSPSYDI